MTHGTAVAPPVDHVAVVIPAADEQLAIGHCLESVVAARDLLRHRTGVGASIVVVLDDCRDRTAAVVAQFAGVTALPVTGRCVGRARGAGSDFAIASSSAPDRLWLANTDADSWVPESWLCGMVERARAGVALLLGRVVPGADLPDDLRSAWHARHDPDDGHHHVHGANLGIRASALTAIGGWPALRVDEDVDLVARAGAAGLRIERPGANPVITSARAQGRTPGGFAAYLRALAAEAGGGLREVPT